MPFAHQLQSERAVQLDGGCSCEMDLFHSFFAQPAFVETKVGFFQSARCSAISDVSSSDFSRSRDRVQNVLKFLLS